MFELPYTPTRQRTAREQQAVGVALPYWVHDLDAPNNYHVKLTLLQPDDLDRLVLHCRNYAAEWMPNENDNRRTLDYPVTNRERCAFIRHCLLNRTDMNTHMTCGYMHSWDNILHRIAKKGVDVEARQRKFKEHVCALIAECYPHLHTEGEYYLWQCAQKTGRTQPRPTINLFEGAQQ